MPRKHLPSGTCAAARSSEGLGTTPSPPGRPQRGRDPPRERPAAGAVPPRRPPAASGGPDASAPRGQGHQRPRPPEPPAGTTTAGSGPPPPPPARGRSFTSGARSSARSQGGRHGARWARPSASPHQASWGGPPGQPGPGDGRRGAGTTADGGGWPGLGAGGGAAGGWGPSGLLLRRKKTTNYRNMADGSACRRGARRDDGGREAPAQDLPARRGGSWPPPGKRRPNAEGKLASGRLAGLPDSPVLNAGAGAVAGRSAAPSSVVRRFAAVGAELYARRKSRWKWERPRAPLRGGSRASVFGP